MSVATPKPTQNDWVKTVLFDRGYLPQNPRRGHQSVSGRHRGLRWGPRPQRDDEPQRTDAADPLSCPTVIDSLSHLEDLGLVVSTTRQRGKVKTYYVSDPPP